MPTGTLKIITFNVWDLPLSFASRRKTRMQKIASYLAESKADIIFLQEVWYHDTRKLFKDCLSDGYYEIESSSIRRKGFSNSCGGLLIFSKFNFADSSFRRFPFLAWPLSECVGRKGVLLAYVATPWGKLRLINLHLYQPRFQPRWQQFQVVRQELERDSETPTILAGDFNEPDLWKKTDYTEVFQALSYSEPRSVAIGPLLTHRRDNFYAQNWSNRVRSSEQIDYIMIKGMEELGLKAVDYQALPLDSSLSDHDPLLLTLSS